MCLAGIQLPEDAPFIAAGLRTDAQLLRERGQPVVAARMELGADVIVALLRRAEDAEGQARINGRTIENAIAESVPVVLPSLFDNIAAADQPIESAYE